MFAIADVLNFSLESIKDRLMSPRLIDVGGFSVIETILQNRENTKRMKNHLIEISVRNKWPPEELDKQLAVLRRRRKANTLTTYKNIGSATRGYGRSLLATGQSGRFYNVTTLDEVTTHVCLGFVGQSWPKPYSAIPEKPPRTQRLVHRCRSYLEFRATPPENTESFIQQFKKDSELQLMLLKPKRYKAYRDGRLLINSYAAFEAAVLYTLYELGIDDEPVEDD